MESRPSRRAALVFLLISMTVFALAAVTVARVKAPWSDEGWFACPAYNLAFRGFMGTSVLEPSGHFLNAYLRGIQQRTYVVPPLHILLLAGWFRVFGFGLMTMRALSILWGLIAMLALFLLVRKLTNTGIALLAAGILSCDFTWLWGCADGRMDAMVTALSLTSLALYVNLRERSFALAFVGANVCLAVACMTHPNAFMAFAALVYLVLHYDRKRIRLTHLLLAAVPYCLGLAAWSVYILQDPADFRIQFLANAAGRSSTRFGGLLEPWNSVWKELLIRYCTYYGFYPVWVPGFTSKWMLVIPVAYFGAAVSLWRGRDVRANDGQRVLLMLLAIWFLMMTFFVGFKAQMYLVYIVPLWDAVLALWAWLCWQGGRAARATAVVTLAVFAVLNWQALWHKWVENSYGNEYLPSVAFLRPYTGHGARLYAITALGFDIDYRDFTDDGRLGFYTHKLADVILIDHSYGWWLAMFQREEKPVYRYISTLLASDYRLAHQSGSFRVYVRNGYAAPPLRP